MPPLFAAKGLNNSPLVIQGGRALAGTIEVQPSKNAALPIIIGSLLTSEPVILQGVPKIADTICILEIVAALGTEYHWLNDHTLWLQTKEIKSFLAPHELISKMRASFVVLGALLGRLGEAKVSMPGGCAFGPRPIDQHVKALRTLGVTIFEENGDFHAWRDKALQGSFVFDVRTVGGTHNALMACVLGQGKVILENVALDPEVTELAHFLNKLGAKISGIGTPILEIEGVDKLKGGEYRIIPDRIEAGTFMLAAAATRGCITLEGIKASQLHNLTARLLEAGVKVIEEDMCLTVDARKGSFQPLSLQASEYPGFPTDLQPQIGAFLTTVPGTSLISDRVYNNRFGHAPELARMGARIELREHTLIIQGGPLHGAPVKAPDIRAGAALIIAALAAEGESTISGMEFINRGYEKLEERLLALGAEVKRDLIPA